jgi:hypothetical protein
LPGSERAALATFRPVAAELFAVGTAAGLAESPFAWEFAAGARGAIFALFFATWRTTVAAFVTAGRAAFEPPAAKLRSWTFAEARPLFPSFRSFFALPEGLAERWTAPALLECAARPLLPWLPLAAILRTARTFFASALCARLLEAGLAWTSITRTRSARTRLPCALLLEGTRRTTLAARPLATPPLVARSRGAELAAGRESTLPTLAIRTRSLALLIRPPLLTVWLLRPLATTTFLCTPRFESLVFCSRGGRRCFLGYRRHLGQ